MKLLILSAVAALTVTGTASAENFDFKVASGLDEYTFTLDTLTEHENDYGYDYGDVTVSDNGVLSQRDIFSSAGYLDFRLGRIGQTEPDFFSESADDESFVPGFYTSQDPYDNRVYAFSITPSVSAAPELSVWALMLSGVAMLGGALRYMFGRRTMLRSA